MKSQKPGQDNQIRTEHVLVETDPTNKVQILRASVEPSEELTVEGGFAVSDDDNCDPYNSTGSHIALKSKKDITR